MRRFFAICVVLLLMAAPAFALSKIDKLSVKAGRIAEMKGQLTVTIAGEKTAIRGAGKVKLPEPYSFETQDDHPMLLAQELMENLGKKKAPITVKTSKSFTIGGKCLTGVFVIQKAKDEFGDEGDFLIPVDKKAGRKGPWTVPAKSGDYYIGVEPDYESEDAAVLSYVKMTVKQ